jgi:hypothetical protein
MYIPSEVLLEFKEAILKTGMTTQLATAYYRLGILFNGNVEEQEKFLKIYERNFNLWADLNSCQKKQA